MNIKYLMEQQAAFRAALRSILDNDHTHFGRNTKIKELESNFLAVIEKELDEWIEQIKVDGWVVCFHPATSHSNEIRFSFWGLHGDDLAKAPTGTLRTDGIDLRYAGEHSREECESVLNKLAELANIKPTSVGVDTVYAVIYSADEDWLYLQALDVVNPTPLGHHMIGHITSSELGLEDESDKEYPQVTDEEALDSIHDIFTEIDPDAERHNTVDFINFSWSGGHE